MAAGQKRPKRERQARWDVTARSWCKRNSFPNGFSLVLERVSDGRRVRGDTMIHRRPLPPAADDDERLSKALEDLRRIMITDIAARGQRLRVYRPDKQEVHAQTRMGNIRAMPGLPTEEDKMEAEYFEIQVDQIANSLTNDLDMAEDFVSREIMLRGYVRALRRRFSAKEIADVALAERG